MARMVDMAIDRQIDQEAFVEDLLTVQDVARLTKSTVAAIYQWRRRGTGPRGIRVGNKILFRHQDIETWLDSRTERFSALAVPEGDLDR